MKSLESNSKHENEPGDMDSRAAAPCCRRFQFAEGFLLDTLTGELWQFTKTAGALVPVPRVDAAAGQADIELINERLQKAADAYRQMLEAVNTLG